MIADSNRDVTERRRNSREEAALRRIATAVAQGAQPHDLLAVVAEEVGRVVAAPSVAVARYEADDTATVCGTFPPQGPLLRTGTRVSLEGADVLGLIREHAEPARVDDYAELRGEIADAVRSTGMRSSVGAPIVVAGRVWGAIVASNTERLPENTGARLAGFTQLVGAAIATTEARTALADEQTALRRVAALVTRAAAPAEIFAAVSAEVDRVFGCDPATFDLAGVVRFEPGPELVVVGVSKSVEAVPLGARFPPDELFAPTHVLRTGRSARVGEGDLAAVGGEVADFLRHHCYLSQVASPIVVDGRPWGAISVNSKNALPPDTEERLERFTELVATAIANAESRDELTRIADQQAALRRVATLVAEGARPLEGGPETLFRAVANEVQALFRTDVSVIVRFEDEGTATTLGTPSGHPPPGTRHRLDPNFAIGAVRRTRRAARFETDEPSAADMPAVVRENGVRSAVASPIVVEGDVWGAICVASLGGSLPPGTEARLADFTELVATAIANAESRDALARLADEQAALRRVATLVARDAPPGEVFDAVAMEVGKLLDTDITVVGRYDGDGSATAIGSWSSSPGGVPVGTRSVVGGHNVLTIVAQTHGPARVDEYTDAWGEAADIARRHGWRSSIAAPIIVEGRVWGVMLVATKRPEPFFAGAEERLAAFTDLLATALANAQAHDELQRFGEEQAALGRVATLVAAGSAPEQVFTAVVEEVSTLLGLERIELVHYDRDAKGTVIASSGGHPFRTGTTWSLDDPSVMATVARTRRPARMDDYTTLTGAIAEAARAGGFQSAIGAPITVEGRLWGVIIAISTDPEPIPERSEARLGQFTELVATAVANAEARDALAQLADEQAALRRVATLVAQGVHPDTIFSAVADEIGRLFGSSITTVGRFEPDPPALVALGVVTGGITVGSRWELDDGLTTTQVFRTGRSARVDEVDWSAVQTRFAPVARRLGIASTVASPIFVEGRLWGVVSVSDHKQLPQKAEARLEKFCELIATALANAEGSAELAASRRRIVAAADEARRRIERDLHDGIQQRLIALTFRARAMTRRPPEDLAGLAGELAEGLKDASDELREVSRGIHPTILTEAGLGPALRALARRSNVPVDVDVDLDVRLPADVEAAAYYIASEALTNVAKHAQATVVELIAGQEDGVLTLEVRDDGVGGVDTNRGSGILGLTDRVEALGGTISIASPPHGGTTFSVRLPTTT